MHSRVICPDARRLRRISIAVALSAGVLLSPLAEAQADVRAGKNYRYATDPRPARGKDAIGFAVNPRNPRHIVAVNADWLNGECEFAMSRNGGRTWRGGDLEAPEGFSAEPCTVGPHLAEHMNAGVAFGGRKRVYATFAAPRIGADGTPEAKSLLVARSGNGGRSFRTAVVAAPGGADEDAGPNYVLPTIAVDRGRRSDRVYAAAASSEVDHTGSDIENVVVAASTDSGRTFGDPVAANAPDDNAIEQSQPVVARDGTVHLAWRSRGKGAQPGEFTPEGFVTIGTSTDEGRTWTQQRAARVNGYRYEGPPAPPFTRGRVFTASTFPRLAIDRRNERLYLVYGDGGTPTLPGAGPQARGADHFIHPDEDVWFQRSADEGASWSSPVRLNDDSPTEISQTRHPNVSVARNGRVDVVWDDRRHWYRGCVHTHSACDELRLSDVYYSFSRNGGDTFAEDKRITDRSTGLDVGYDYRFGTGWAYGPFSVPLGNRRILVGWMDTRRGNFDNDTQDIFLSRVNLRHRGAVPVQRIRRRTLPAFAVRLSRLAYPGGPEAVLGATFATRPWTRVVIVNQNDTAAALMGSVLARANIATVLPSRAGRLPRRVRAEVSRLSPIGAFVIGDESELSGAVVEDLTDAGVPEDQIVRLSGETDPETAALVAQAMDRRTDAEAAGGEPAFDAAIVANAASPDAAAVSAWAANRRLPVLFADRNSVPQATTDALNSLGIERTYVVGNAEWIGPVAFGELPTPKRVGGRNHFGTSRAAVDESLTWQVPGNILYATPGSDPMAAALAGAPVGRLGGLLAYVRRPARRPARKLARQLDVVNQLDRIRVLRPPARSGVK